MLRQHCFFRTSPRGRFPSIRNRDRFLLTFFGANGNERRLAIQQRGVSVAGSDSKLGSGNDVQMRLVGI